MQLGAVFLDVRGLVCVRVCVCVFTSCVQMTEKFAAIVSPASDDEDDSFDYCTSCGELFDDGSLLECSLCGDPICMDCTSCDICNEGSDYACESCQPCSCE